MNTYNGEIGRKSDSQEDEIIMSSGLTVLHPYYTHITLLPFS